MTYCTRRVAIILILGAALSLGGLIGCQPAPLPISPTYNMSPEFAFRQFILHYYRNEEARLHDKYGAKSIVRDTGWDVRVTVKQITMTNSTHGVVLYTVTERWETGLQGAEGIQPIVSHWEKTETQWRLVSIRKGRSIKSYWDLPDD